MTAKLPLSSQKHVALRLSFSPPVTVNHPYEQMMASIYLIFFSILYFAAQKSKGRNQNYRLIIITSTEEVMFFSPVGLLVCWFVSTITQTLLNVFLGEGWVSAQKSL